MRKQAQGKVSDLPENAELMMQSGLEQGSLNLKPVFLFTASQYFA